MSFIYVTSIMMMSGGEQRYACQLAAYRCSHAHVNLRQHAQCMRIKPFSVYLRPTIAESWGTRPLAFEMDAWITGMT